MTDVASLNQMSRSELVEEARRQGIERPERLTRVELRAELGRRREAPVDEMDARGLWGVARSMVASVVEAGLKMPETASKIRGDASIEVPVRNQAPVATVTLAEIYAAQGHKKRALAMLREVLAQEPDHEEAARIYRELTVAGEESDGTLGAGTSSEAAASASSGLTETASRQAPTPSSGPMWNPPRPSEAAPAEPSPTAAEKVTVAVAVPGPGPSTEYVPPNFVDTTGEDIVTGEPPSVVAVEPREPVGEEPISLGDAEPDPVLVLAQRIPELLLYVELTEDAVLRRGLDPREGRPVVQVVVLVPSVAHPVRREEQLELTLPSQGLYKLSGFGPTDAVRAALGWLRPSGFVPLTLGRNLDELGRPEVGSVAARAERAMGA